MQTSSTCQVESKMDSSSPIAAATTSITASIVSFAASTLPLMQWIAAAVAIISGLTGVAWVAYQYVQRRLKA